MNLELTHHRGSVAATVEAIPARRRPKALPFFIRLALFQEAVSYDLRTRLDLDVQPQPVKLELPWISPEIRLFRPNSSTQEVKRVSGAREIELEVPDEVLLVEIQPPKAAK
ncbi:MAG: hypothetical protein ACREP9_01645 [Candidatus Dormibacteraceae bacterium]